MIRVRTSEGESIELTGEGNFVEICDADHNPALVFYTGDNSISQISKDMEEAKLYEARFNCKFAQVINLQDRYEDDE
jgi:hypothetical protein